MTLPDSHILRLLRSQSHLLTHEIGLMPADAVLWKATETEWSVHETLTHVRNIEREVFRYRLIQTATLDTPPLPFFDEGAYHKEHWNATEPIQNILADFVADRAAEVALLETADGSRAGVHPTRGSITLDWQANYIVNHTWEHLSQIMRVRLNYIVGVTRSGQ